MTAPSTTRYATMVTRVRRRALLPLLAVMLVRAARAVRARVASRRDLLARRSRVPVLPVGARRAAHAGRQPDAIRRGVLSPAADGVALRAAAAGRAARLRRHAPVRRAGVLQRPRRRPRVLAVQPAVLPAAARRRRQLVRAAAPARRRACMWLFLRDLGAGAGRRRRGRRRLRAQRPLPDVAQRADADRRGVAAAGAAPGPPLRAARAGGPTSPASRSRSVRCSSARYLATTLVCLFGAGVYGLIELWMTAGTPRRGVRDDQASVEGDGPLGERSLPSASARSVLALAAGGVLGLCVGAVALWPMLAALRGLPGQCTRGVGRGRPLGQPRDARAARLLGIAAARQLVASRRHRQLPGARRLFRHRRRAAGRPGAGRAPVARAVDRRAGPSWRSTGVALTRAYGGVPGRWLVLLPGQAQSNPFRWYALAACGLAVLAGLGLHAWLARARPTPPAVAARRPARWSARLLAAVTGGRAADVPAGPARPQPAGVRARAGPALRGDRRRQPAGAAGSAPGCTTQRAATAVRPACSWRIAAADLVQAHRGFNPTRAARSLLPHDREPRLAARAGIRDAPGARRHGRGPDRGPRLGHVRACPPSPASTSTATRDYQDFMRLAQQPPGTHGAGSVQRRGTTSACAATRSTCACSASSAPATSSPPPIDLTPRAGGYVPHRPDGRRPHVTFTVPVRHDGLRGIDLLTRRMRGATTGAGTGRSTIDDGQVVSRGQRRAGRRCATTTGGASTWPPVERSAGRSLTVVIRERGQRRRTAAPRCSRRARRRRSAPRCTSTRPPIARSPLVPHVLDRAGPLRRGARWCAPAISTSIATRTHARAPGSSIV